MPNKRHSKESLIQTLQNLAARLHKDTLTLIEVAEVISPSVVRDYFGSLGNALEAAGLRRASKAEHLDAVRPVLSQEELFLSLFRVEQLVGREPRTNDYSAHGEYSVKPYKKRFGNWPNTLKHYRRWKSENPERCSLSPDSENGPTHAEATPEPSERLHPQLSHTIDSTAKIPQPAQLYGEPLDFRGLRHAPINEQGVVYLFGMVSRELGFYIEAIQQGFPDCEGKYLYDAKKNLWAKARIEFEFRASCFREHGHDANQCDFVVCWINDWPECPVTVIELRKEILKLRTK